VRFAGSVCVYRFQAANAANAGSLQLMVSAKRARTFWTVRWTMRRTRLQTTHAGPAGAARYELQLFLLHLRALEYQLA
jgi:hypothetical protein